MSKPQNILAKYRTYSYHHILIACDNEAAAEFLRSTDSRSVYSNLHLTRPITIDEQTGLVDVDEFDPETGKTNRTQVGAFVVILNGMVDTSFIVKNVEWFSATAASAVAGDQFTSLAVEGRMIVEEPRGVRFLNKLNGACDLLQSDPSGVIWLLKTIFVGHNDDGSRSDYISDLRPLEFMMYDVTGTFSITGGLYEISFAGAANGAARFPQFSRIAKEIPIRTGDGKLETALKDLEKGMNAKSETNRTCVIKALEDAYRADSADIDVFLGLENIPSEISSELSKFRLVKYGIQLEAPYTNDEYKIDTLNPGEKDVQNADDGIVKAGINTTVEQQINNLMNRCTQVMKDRNEGDENGIKYIPKIHSEITMVGKDSINPITNTASQTDVVAVVYRIRRHAELNNQTVERVLAGDQGLSDESPEVTAQKIRENTIELDYFFTGANTDIIDFDLKMDMGLAFLQTIASTNTIGTGTHQISGVGAVDLNSIVILPNENERGNPAVSADGEKKPKILIRPKTPIFPATNTNNVYTKNIRGALDSTLYQMHLTRHAALESIEAKVTIHGNPYLMSQTNRRPSDTQRRGNTSDESEDVTNVMQNWEFMPGLAKVNIWMPKTNDTPSDRDTFERERFWYDGHYYIYGIDHKFDDGQFTQDLNLLSLPNQSELDKTQRTNITECGEETPPEGEETETTETETTETETTTDGAEISPSGRVKPTISEVLDAIYKGRPFG
jgi:hypothetical protein